jgi:two-component system, cell cycle sensor histidine kinase and response regulator CckA
MTFARGGNAMMGPVRVDHLARELGWIIKDILPQSIHCRITTQPDSWPVIGMATQIHQVLMNLAINARDAMENGGELVISTQNLELTDSDVADKPGRRAGRYLCLSVADTGPGIPPEKLSRIFEPFFTTKAPGKGSGLGLPTSQTIVQNHGGFITVESTVGRGTEFKIFLPAKVEISTGTAASPVMLPAGRGERILVVDDEVAVLAVVKASLENYNYRVFTAASGPEAIACFSEQQHQIELVITDMVMPYMDGAATIEALRKIRPDVKIIAATGLDQKQDSRTIQARPLAYLQKPLTVEKLLLTTHQVLTQQAASKPGEIA